MAINNVSEGQTFKDWLDATNQVINEINNAVSKGTANRMVRYDQSGALSIGTFASNQLSLENGFTVNNISNTVNTATADNFTLVTAAGIAEYLTAAADNVTSGDGYYALYSRNAGVDISANGNAIAIFTEAQTTFTANVHIGGNLTVDGESVSISTTELTVEDKTVTFNKGGVFDATGDGAGFEIENDLGNIVASLTYDSSAEGFDLSANTKNIKIVPHGSLTLNVDQDLSTSSEVAFSQVSVSNTLFVPVNSVTPAVANSSVGQIQYNTTDSTFEGFDGIAWGSLGGVSTPDKSTRIVANTATRVLEFSANNTAVATFQKDALAFEKNSTFAADIAVNGELSVIGETFIHDNAYIDGDVTANGVLIALGSNEVQLRDYKIALTQDVAGIASSVSADDTTVPTSNAVFTAIADVNSSVSSLDLSLITNQISQVSIDSANTVRVSIEGTETVIFDKNGLVLPTINDASVLGITDGTIRYNSNDAQFQGFFGGTWQGLGGVITPDKATSIVANPNVNQLEFKANGVTSLTITEDAFRLWGAPIDTIDNSVAGAGATTILTASVVDDRINAARAALQTDIDTRAVAQDVIDLQNDKADKPSIDNKILGWDGATWIEMSMPETINLPNESSDSNSFVKFNQTSNTFYNVELSQGGYEAGDVVTPPTASGTEQVLQWDGNNIVNVTGFASTNFVRQQFLDASGNPLPATAPNQVLSWSGGASGKLQHKTLSFVDDATLASRFPQADTPDGYVLAWDSANNKVVSVDGFATEDDVKAYFPANEAQTGEITVWNGGAFENIALSTTTVSSVGFDANSLTPQLESNSNQALQWKGGKFTHAVFANTAYVDQEVSTRATQAYVIAQVDGKADQSEITALQATKADDAEIKTALTNKLDKLGAKTADGNYLYWDGDTFAEGALPPAIGLPGGETGVNQMLRWNASGTFENVDIATVTVSDESANNVVPEAATGTTGVVQWNGEAFINVPGFATEKFITDKFPLQTSDASQKEVLTWTVDGFRNRSLDYLTTTEFNAKFPMGTPAADDVLRWDAANNKIVPVGGYAKSTDITVRFPDTDETTQANQVLKWDGNKLIHVEKPSVSVTPEEAADIIPDETSGDYDILQFRNDKLVNVSGVFAQREEFLGLRDTATTKSYVDGKLSEKADDNEIRSIVSDKADQQFVEDELALKAARPVLAPETPSNHYLRWTPSGFVAEEFTDSINLPSAETLGTEVLRWTGSAFENATVATVAVSQESANNVVPGTKTSNTGAVQWTGTEFVNKDGFATEEFVEKKMPKDAVRSDSLTEVLTWAGTGYAKVDLANTSNPMATKAFVNDKIAVSGDTPATEVLVWKGGKLDSAPAQFAAKADVSALTVSLTDSTQDNQVLKWVGGEFQHATVAEKIITTEGFDAAALTPNDYSSRSQALQWHESGTFRHASFVTPSDLATAIANTVNAEFVESKFTGYTNTMDMDNALALKVDVSAHSAALADKVNKPGDTQTPANHYLYWTGSQLAEREIVTSIGTPNLDTEDGQILTWNATEQRFEHAALSTTGFEAPDAFVTPTYGTSTSQVLAWNATDGKFENRNGFATEQYVKDKLPATTGWTTASTEALVWSGREFQNKDLSDTFATIDYVDGITPEQTTTSSQVLHWDNDAGKLVEYTGFATQKSVDDMLPTGSAGTNRVLSWTGSKFEFVTISTVTIDESTFDANTFMPSTESTSTQALQWNGSEFVHGDFANTSYIDEVVDGFVDADYVATAVTNRAQKSYVDNRLKEKANTADVTVSLQAKMDVPTLSDSSAGHYLVMDGGTLSEKEFTIPFTTPADSGDGEVLQWFDGGFINAQITTTVMNESDAGNILPGTGTGDDGEKVVIWNAVANTFQNIASPYAKKADLESIKPASQSITANNEVLKWTSDGTLKSIDIVDQFGLAKASEIVKPSKTTGEGEVLTWNGTDFVHVDANTSYVDDMMPDASDVTTDNKRLKWDGQRFVNVAISQRVIEKETFDEEKFMPNEASTSVQALQWDGNNFVHGVFANTNYIDAEIAKKVGKNYVDTAVQDLVSISRVEELEGKAATISFVESEVGDKAPKPATTQPGHYLTWDAGWQQVKAANTIAPPATETQDGEMVKWNEAEQRFENIAFTTVNVSETAATNILPAGETPDGGAVRWDAANSKFEHVSGFVTQDYIDVRMPDKYSVAANNEVLVWTSDNKFVNRELNFLSQSDVREGKFPNTPTVTGQVLKWDNVNKEFTTSDEFVQKTTFSAIFPDESSDVDGGYVAWSVEDGEFINKKFAASNIDSDTFDATALMPQAYSATNEALQWMENDTQDGGVFKHAKFANSAYVTNKLTETEARVLSNVEGQYAKSADVTTVSDSVAAIQADYVQSADLGNFATKPAESMNSGEYLYWAGGKFEKGTLPVSLNKPEESGTNEFLVWKDNAFQNVTLSPTPISPDQVADISPQTLSQEYSDGMLADAIQWIPGASEGDSDRFANKTFATAAYVDSKLPTDDARATSSDFDALQWNGSEYVNSTLSFLRSDDLTAVLPESTGSDGVVTFAGGKFTKSTDFAKKSYIDSKLPEPKGADNLTSTQANQTLVWNGQRLENIALNTIEFEKSELSTFTFPSCNSNEALQWDGQDFGKQTFASQNYVDTAIGDLDTTSIQNPSGLQIQALADASSFEISSVNKTLLSLSDAQADFGTSTVKAGKLILNNALVKGVASSIESDGEVIPTSKAVDDAIRQKLQQFGGELSADMIVSANTRVQATNENVAFVAENANVMTLSKNSISIEKPTVFADGVDVVVGGDLTVKGTTSTINAVDLEVQDKNILLNKGAGPTNGAGISVDGSTAFIQLNTNSDTWEISDATGAANIGSTTGNNVGIYVGADPQIVMNGTNVTINKPIVAQGNLTLKSHLITGIQDVVDNSEDKLLTSNSVFQELEGIKTTLNGVQGYAEGQVQALDAKIGTANTFLQGYTNTANNAMLAHVEAGLDNANTVISAYADSVSAQAYTDAVNYTNTANNAMRLYVDGEFNTLSSNTIISASGSNHVKVTDNETTITGPLVIDGHKFNGVTDDFDAESGADRIPTASAVNARISSVISGGEVAASFIGDTSTRLDVSSGILGKVNGATVLNVSDTAFTFESNITEINMFVGKQITGMDSSSTLSLSNTFIPSSQTVRDEIDAANTAMGTYVDAANTAMKGYVDAANNAVSSAMNAETLRVDTAIAAANTAMKGYVDTANTALTSSIGTANTAMGQYVDAKISTLRGEVTGELGALSANTIENSAKTYNVTTNENDITVDADGNLTVFGATNTTFNNDVVMTANLTVTGTTTTINAQDLAVTDKEVTLNKGGTSGSAQGAGVTIDQTNASITLSNNLNWKLKGENTYATIEGDNKFCVMVDNATQLDITTSSADFTVPMNGTDATLSGALTVASIETSGTANTANMNVSSALNTNSLDVAYDAIIQSCLTTQDLIVQDSLVELSSAALKTDVAPIEGALAKIMSLEGVEFNWINRKNEMKEYGLIAEKVAKVAPNLVAFENEQAQGIKYSKMVSLLIEGMKEQQREINELKKKLN